MMSCCTAESCEEGLDEEEEKVEREILCLLMTGY